MGHEKPLKYLLLVNGHRLHMDINNAIEIYRTKHYTFPSLFSKIRNFLHGIISRISPNKPRI